MDDRTLEMLANIAKINDNLLGRLESAERAIEKLEARTTELESDFAATCGTGEDDMSGCPDDNGDPNALFEL